jgi:Ca-activated chloride channel family protein
MAEFHFLRPLWLLLLPVALFAAWRIGTGAGGVSGWRAVVDKALQPYVLSDGGAVRQRRWPLLAALAAAVAATLALAGPAWDRQPVPAFRSDESLVVAIDLSRSMDATDVAPSRLARARIKLLDLLDRRDSGQTALVAFTANAFTVTPLTTDTRTIASLVNALSTEIMPSQGSLLEVGLEKSEMLLAQSGVTAGEILVITDAVASPATFRLAEALNDRGITVSVLAVGTEEGGPIPELGGGFVTDDRGQVVVPQLNVDNLRRLAAAGGGRFARLSLGDADLDQLYPGDASGGTAAGAGDDDRREVDIWRDQGIWLSLLLLPLVALGFRRGWVYVLVAAIALPAPRAEAFEWSDLWLNPDQQGLRAMERDAPAEAAALFDDPEWLAAARYRAGDFDSSAAALAGIDTPDGHYNRGNALARGGRLAEAIDAYDAALALDADHEDAKFNRDLVADLLEQQQQQQDQQGESEEPQTGAGENQQQGEQGEQQQAQSAGDDNQGQPQASSEDQRGTDPGDSQQESEAPDEAGDENREAGSESLQAATLEDVEDWASEQAAEQWLRRIPQDPGGLLRRKFLYQYQQLGVDQDGNRIWPGSSAEPW